MQVYGLKKTLWGGHRFFFLSYFFLSYFGVFWNPYHISFIIFLSLRIFYHIFLYHILKFFKIFIIFYIIFFWSFLLPEVQARGLFFYLEGRRQCFSSCEKIKCPWKLVFLGVFGFFHGQKQFFTYTFFRIFHAHFLFSRTLFLIFFTGRNFCITGKNLIFSPHSYFSS